MIGVRKPLVSDDVAHGGEMKVSRFLLPVLLLVAILLPWRVGADSGVAGAGTVDSVKKMFRFLWALVGVGVLGLPVEAGALSCANYEDLYYWYDKADAVVFARVVSAKEENIGKWFGYSQKGVRLEVLRSWKAKVPESAQVYSLLNANEGTIGVFYVFRNGEGNFLSRAHVCFGDEIWSENSIQERIRWLDQITECGCKVFDMQSLHNAADAIVIGYVLGGSEEDGKEFVDIIALQPWHPTKHVNNVTPHVSMTFSMDSRNNCAYSFVKGSTQLLYLRRSRDGGYTTDACSGNLRDFGGYGRSEFLRKYPKDDILVNKCKCAELDAQGFYDRADAVIHAEAKRIVRRGAKRYIELEIDNVWKAIGTWKTTGAPRRLFVFTGDVRKNCEHYPVPLYGHVIMYLRSDKGGGFSTDACSGNLEDVFGVNSLLISPDSPLGQRMQWLKNLEKEGNHEIPDFDESVVELPWIEPEQTEWELK
jgi:hypothetical protein